MKFRFKIYLGVFLSLLLAGIAGFMFFEKMSLTDALYFSIVTMATVGYGDIHPETNIGKILALIIIIGGVGTFLGLIASFTDIFVNRREEKIRKQKLDMMTGLFFSEMGNDLLKHFTRFDQGVDILYENMQISVKWDNKDFNRAYSILKEHRPLIDSNKGDIQALLSCLRSRADFLLRLIENPIIHEHGDFSELLRALFHLRDELSHRDDLFELLDTDRKHLEIDISRVYRLLVFEWLRYIQYIKQNYSYLFSLAIRMNPFNPEANAVVNE